MPRPKGRPLDPEHRAHIAEAMPAAASRAWDTRREQAAQSGEDVAEFARRGWERRRLRKAARDALTAFRWVRGLPGYECVRCGALASTEGDGDPGTTISCFRCDVGETL